MESFGMRKTDNTSNRVTPMADIRDVRESSQAPENAAKRECSSGLSDPSLKRVLSMEAVMDDMRAILWTNRCDLESPQTEFVSHARLRK
jgi:hypothetical protein